MTNKELFNSCIIRFERLLEVDCIVTRMLDGRSEYLPVVQATGVPWWFIGIIHILETGGNFTRHLHNGDHLSARTVHVPSGRPVAGNPPFNWQESAIDALAIQGLCRPTKEQGKPYTPLSWNVFAALDRMERYNGLGYRKQNMPSPYLWAASQHYLKGKFVTDGRFDPNAVSRQVGGGVILKRMIDRKLINP
jgi:lysozyme family protein